MKQNRSTRQSSSLSRGALMGLVLLLPALGGLPAAALEEPGPQPPGAVGFDTERQIWLFDTDGDTFPDLTEEIGGTDPHDERSNPVALMEAAAVAAETGEGSKVGFQQATCRSSMISPAPRLCIDRWVQNEANLTQAITNCRARFARVCTYADLGYLYLVSNVDASYDPSGGKWLGDDWYQDDIVICGNQFITFNNDPEIWNFEGQCNKAERHAYWCCHDRT